MNKVHKRTRLIGGVLAAGMFTLVAVAPSATAAPRQKAAVSTGSASFTITREDSMSIDYTEAITPPGRIPLTGDFVGDNTDTGNLDDIFWYTPGAGGDSIWRTNGDRSWTATSTSVTGAFTPLVGQFTNDGKADIFWYAPGPAVDSLWDFNANGSITKIDGASVNGTYTPIVGFFSEDSSQDIIWYSPGSGARRLVGLRRRHRRADRRDSPSAARTRRSSARSPAPAHPRSTTPRTSSGTPRAAPPTRCGTSTATAARSPRARSRSTAPTPRSPATSATTASTT